MERVSFMLQNAKIVVAKYTIAKVYVQNVTNVLTICWKADVGLNKQQGMFKGKRMFFRKSRCYNGGGQHKFSPRHDEKPNPYLKINCTWGFATHSQVRSLVYYKEYLFDICEWCGKKIKR